MTRLLMLALVALAPPAFAGPALDEPVCVSLPGAAAMAVKRDFGQSEAIRLQMPNDMLNAEFIIYLNPETETWSMFLAAPSGDCLLTGGVGALINPDIFLGEPS